MHGNLESLLFSSQPLEMLSLYLCLSPPVGPCGPLDKLVHDISLIFQNHLQLRWLLELLYDLLENISLEKNIPSIMVFSVFLSLVLVRMLVAYLAQHSAVGVDRAL